MNEAVRKSDVFWLRAAAMRDPGFYPGAPWRASPSAFERLERYGLVVKVESETVAGLFSARATADGLQAIDRIRLGNLARRAKEVR